MKNRIQKFSVLIICLIFAVTIAQAFDDDIAKIRKELPALLGTTNQGKEFFMTFHPCWEESGKNNDLKIYITSAVETRVTIEIPGKEVFIQRITIPNDIIEITLDPSIGQCYRKSDREPPQPQRIFKGYGIIVTAEDPIVCYGVTRFRYTSDGYLAIPKSALGKKYVVSSYNDPCQDNSVQYLTSFTSIVAAYNKTEVKVRLGGRFSNYTPGLNSMHTDDSRTEKLNKGDVWLIGVQGDYADLTGTYVEADKPVSVISGNFCAYVPIQVSSCDFIIEQDLPMETWGYKYHVTNFFGRKKASIIRVFASEPNTTIMRDGNEWSLVKGVGGEEGTGYIERRSVDVKDKLRPVMISSKNRIAVTQYNTGQSDDQVESDPFQLVLTPIEQYQKGFLWCTPGFKGGVSFRRNYLNLCFKATDDGQIPDDIEFGKVNNGTIYWRKLSSVATNPGTPFIDETETANYHTVTLVIDDPAGVYSLRGNEGMAAYGYGFDVADSYGFPVSLALSDMTIPDIWAPLVNYSIDCIGQVEGIVIDQPENDQSLRSNLADISLVKSQSYNFTKIDYDEAAFIPGTTMMMQWSLKVQDIEYDARAVLNFLDRAGNDTVVTIDYKCTRFSIKNKIENWGAKSYNAPTEWREFKLVNESSKPVIVDSLFLISSEKGRYWNYNGFKIDSSIYSDYGGVLPGYTIQPGEELKFKVSFAPQTLVDDILSGKTQFLDSIGIKAYWSTDVRDFCYFKYRSALKATIGSPCISIDRLDFGKVTVNNSLTKTTAIFNKGTTDLTITGYTLPAGVYTSDLINISAGNPLIIEPNGSYQFKVTFTPTDVIQFPSQIVFESDANLTCSSNDPILELTGEGIQPGLELIGFDWPRLRVHLSVYDQANNPHGNSMFPYTSKVGTEFTSMRLSNTGNQDFTITEAFIKDTVNPEYFLIDVNNDGKPDGPISDNLNIFKNKIVLPNDITIYPVFYDPKDVGNHSVTIVIKGEKDGFQIEGECTFRGTGVYPRGISANYMFTKDEPNQTAIADSNHPGYDVNVKFTSDNWGEFADGIKIYDLKLMLAEGKGISTDISIPGDRLFAFENDSLKFPITLNLGDTLSFPAKYYPVQSSPFFGANPFIAHVVYVTDADVSNYTSEWSGKSITQGASVTGTTISSCVKYSELGTITITNIADDEIQVSDVYIRPIGGDSTALTIVDDKPFKLAAGKSKDIQVIYKQDNLGITDADIVFVTSIKSTPEISAPINCSTISYPRKTIGKINGKSYSEANPLKIISSKNPSGEASNKFSYSVYLDSVSNDLTKITKETNFDVEIVYNYNFLGAEFDNLKKHIVVDLGEGLNPADYLIVNVTETKIDDKFAIIRATIQNISGNPIISKKEIEICKLNFNVFLPQKTIDSSKKGEKLIQIKQRVTTNEACISLSPYTNDAFADPYAELQELCLESIRTIDIHESQFGLKEVDPNPVGTNGAEISYSLGFECTTEITIFNSVGSIVAKPVNKKQTAGLHNVPVPVNELASGLYFIELKAGPYVCTTKLVISK
ncbi:MAG: choice-of-anchor D domain-containing protein [bacterium]